MKLAVPADRFAFAWQAVWPAVATDVAIRGARRRRIGGLMANLFTLPPAYPAPMPPGESGRHRPADACQWCGGEMGKSKCKGCGRSLHIDCRRIADTLPCSVEGCRFRGSPGADLHDCWDGHEIVLFCPDHCPECNPPTGGTNDD